ncbi:DUF2946 family protein [Deinococcus sp. Marseille-Q6407]|uniref:DUF2946 family protein n=1 Tax=Deinococcus sp. Marseille-Q6407 TaxID=2969223 RepID=UPI0021BE7F57|nr:DUF2946 family protein [Deinococcus sp. Marseille-Q6407]
MPQCAACSCCVSLSSAESGGGGVSSEGRCWARCWHSWLLALLAVLGGAAFQLRSGDGLSPELYAAAQAHPLAAAEHAGPHHGDHQGQHSGHDHGAHCPFCVTQAFGEAASPLMLQLPPPDPLPAAPLQQQAAARALPRCADARAPPLEKEPTAQLPALSDSTRLSALSFFL